MTILALHFYDPFKASLRRKCIKVHQRSRIFSHSCEPRKLQSAEWLKTLRTTFGSMPLDQLPKKTDCITLRLLSCGNTTSAFPRMRHSAIQELLAIIKADRKKPEGTPLEWPAYARRLGPPARALFFSLAHDDVTLYSLAKYLDPEIRNDLDKLSKGERKAHARADHYAKLALGVKERRVSGTAQRHYLTNILALLPPEPTEDRVARRFMNSIAHNGKLRREYLLYCAKWDPRLESNERYPVDTFLRYLLFGVAQNWKQEILHTTEWALIKEIAQSGTDFSHRTKAANILSWHNNSPTAPGDVAAFASSLPSRFPEIRRGSETPINAPVCVLPWLPAEVARRRQTTFDVLLTTAQDGHPHVSSTSLVLLSAHVNEINAFACFQTLVDWLIARSASIWNEESQPVVRTAAYAFEYLNGITFSCAEQCSSTLFGNRLQEMIRYLADGSSRLDTLARLVLSLHKHSHFAAIMDRFADCTLPILRGMDPGLTRFERPRYLAQIS